MKLIAPKDLIGLLGTFWSRIVSRPLLSERLAEGLLATHYQSEQKVDELVKAVSNVDITPGQTTTFEKFIFVQDGYVKFEYNGNPLLKHNQGYTYGVSAGDGKSYSIPENIISIPTLYDNPVNPTKTYTEGVDYKLESGKLTFRVPVPISKIMYARKVTRDTGFVFRQLSYIIGVNLSDSIFRKIPLAELWRLFSYGPNYYNFMRLISLCANSPITKHDKELVQGIIILPEVKLVITDKEVYCVPKDQLITVVTGKVLAQAEPLASGLKVLHDKHSIVYINTDNYSTLTTQYKYGSELLNPSKLILLKADIQGAEAIVLKYLKDVLPLDIKIIILANKTVPAAQISDIRLTAAKIYNSVAAPNYTNTNLQITPKCDSSLKYSFYGF